MGSDFGILSAGVGLLQQAAGFGEVAGPEFNPCHAVYDERIGRRKFQCLLDKLARLRQAYIAIGQ